MKSEDCTASIEHKLAAEQAAPCNSEVLTAEGLARRFHGLYEREAVNHGYTTRPETREFNPKSRNGQLMTTVCKQVLKDLGLTPQD